MNILHRYVLRQALVTLLVTVAVFSFVLLMGQVLKEVSRMMVNQRLGLEAVLWFLLLILPYVLSFSLPMAMLATSLLVFGRLSADNEITAMRASGVSLGQVIAPVVLLAAAMTGVCLYINTTLAPACKSRIRSFFVNQALDNPMSMLVEGAAIRAFPGYVVYVGRRVEQKRLVEDLVIYSLNDDGHVVSKITADRGTVSIDAASQKLLIDLENVEGDLRDPKDPTNVHKIRPGIRADRYPLEFDLSQLLRKSRQVKKRASDASVVELRQEIADLKQAGIYPGNEIVEVHQRYALAAACLAFTFIAIPLGIKASRRETSVGMAISLGLALVFYLVMIVASSLKNRPEAYPEAILWLPNLAFQLIGLWLIRRVSRG
jgi:lipopolysaccharide export system permease protein